MSNVYNLPKSGAPESYFTWVRSSQILDKAGNTLAYYKNLSITAAKSLITLAHGCQDTSMFIFLPDKNSKM